jgi:hypothetical protein
VKIEGEGEGERGWREGGVVVKKEWWERGRESGGV